MIQTCASRDLIAALVAHQAGLRGRRETEVVRAHLAPIDRRFVLLQPQAQLEQGLRRERLIEPGKRGEVLLLDRVVSLLGLDETPFSVAAFNRGIVLGTLTVATQADGVVTLTGTVRSWAERNAIERAAQYAPGVRRVDDRTILDPMR